MTKWILQKKGGEIHIDTSSVSPMSGSTTYDGRSPSLSAQEDNAPQPRTEEPYRYTPPKCTRLSTPPSEVSGFGNPDDLEDEKDEARKDLAILREHNLEHSNLLHWLKRKKNKSPGSDTQIDPMEGIISQMQPDSVSSSDEAAAGEHEDDRTADAVQSKRFPNPHPARILEAKAGGTCDVSGIKENRNPPEKKRDAPTGYSTIRQVKSSDPPPGSAAAASAPQEWKEDLCELEICTNCNKHIEDLTNACPECKEPASCRLADRCNSGIPVDPVPGNYVALCTECGGAGWVPVVGSRSTSVVCNYCSFSGKIRGLEQSDILYDNKSKVWYMVMQYEYNDGRSYHLSLQLKKDTFGYVKWFASMADGRDVYYISQQSEDQSFTYIYWRHIETEREYIWKMPMRNDFLQKSRVSSRTLQTPCAYSVCNGEGCIYCSNVVDIRLS